jgi:eukaryotic-like serine/threonine-protein kinase
MAEKALERGALIAGRYRLERPLGEGGMATVWEATHMVTRRVVAMKFLRDTLRNKPELRLRFLIEASAASALSHPNVVEILDVFDAEEQLPVMVMELLRGETLGQKLERDERLGLEETATLLLPVISAVGIAHSLGIVHRDLKPDNVFLVNTDAGIVVKVLDFGIAKLTAGHHAEHGAPALRTVTGSILGTPSYMAPEQATGDAPIDHRADVWSIGVMLYECLSGTRPIEGENIAQVMARLVTAGIIPLERIAPDLPDEVAAAVSKMLTRDVTLRTPDLRDAFALLGRHTRVKAPGFGAPATGETPSSVAVLGAPPVSSSKWVATDARAPTLLSPTISSSVTLTTGRRVLAARWSPLFAVTFIALVGGGLAITLWLLRRPSDAPADALASSPEVIPAAPPVLAAPAGAPTQAASPSAVLPSASAVAQRPTRWSPKAPTRAAAARAPTVRAPAQDPAPKPQDSDLTFPGGRK